MNDYVYFSHKFGFCLCSWPLWPCNDGYASSNTASTFSMNCLGFAQTNILPPPVSVYRVGPTQTPRFSCRLSHTLKMTKNWIRLVKLEADARWNGSKLVQNKERSFTQHKDSTIGSWWLYSILHNLSLEYTTHINQFVLGSVLGSTLRLSFMAFK